MSNSQPLLKSNPFFDKKTVLSRIAPLFVILFLLGVAAPFWNVPLNRDQGVYATCAQSLLRGNVPFRGCWDTKGPAMHYTYALAEIIFGHTPSGPYILNAIVIAVSSLALAKLASLWIGVNRWLAYATGLLYGLLAIAIRFDMNAQPESFANLFALVGFLGITLGQAKTRRWPLLLGGGLLAIAVFYKYALILPYGVTALSLILLDPEQTASQRVMFFALTLSGALGLTAGFAIYLFSVGALGDAITHLQFIFFYFPKAQLNPDEYALRSQPVQQTLEYFGRLPVVIGASLIGIGVALHRRRWVGWVTMLAFVAGVVVVWGQQRFTPYHWTASLPAFALGCGILLKEVTSLPTAKFRMSLSLLLGAALLVNTGAFFYIDQWKILGAYLMGHESQEVFYERQGTWDHAIAAQYIRERTMPTDKIWVWGHHTAIYYLADRASPTRFIYNEPLLMHVRGGNPWQDAWRAEALDDIYRDPPVYLLLTTFDRTFFDFKNPNISWRDIPEYRAFTDLHYRMEYEFGRFQFFRLIPYWSRQNAPELLNDVTRIDLIREFDSASIDQTIEPPPKVLSFDMPGEPAYETLLLAPEGRLTYSLTLPSAPVCFRVDLALYPDSWVWGGDGANFTVSVASESGDGQSILLDTYISNAPEDQHWHPYLLDLSQYADQKIRFTLQTGPGPVGDFTGDWAGWGLPRIVQPPAGTACDTNVIVDTRQ